MSNNVELSLCSFSQYDYTKNFFDTDDITMFLIDLILLEWFSTDSRDSYGYILFVPSG